MTRHFYALFISLIALGSCADLPTLYEYYTSNGISSGLSVDQPYFTLNGKNISIYSGAIHYFRVPPQYWQDRLRKLRAAGLNAVETYVPWNLHEPQNGVFDFGSGGTDFEQFLDLETFIKLAQEEDLFVIIRPGPYICAEWEWGGFPSWLLTEDVKIRTADDTYFNYVKRYFGQLLPIIVRNQFQSGGSIIAVQIENEYGNSPYKSRDHVEQLYNLMIDSGINELLFTGDNARAGTSGTIPGVLFQTLTSTKPLTDLPTILEMQPDKPLLAIEYYPGWFDSWAQRHQSLSTDDFRTTFEGILAFPASVNVYVFHGGTNWGFMNGALIPKGPDNSGFQPSTTSYDYGAPISEAGDYTEKYDVIKELVEKYNTIKTKTPDPPALVERQQYPSIKIHSYLSFEDIINQTPSVTSDTPLPMEKLPINDNSGQGYGYTVYRQENINIPKNSVLTITGHIRDTLMVLINGVEISKPLSSRSDLDGFGFWRIDNSSMTLTSTDLEAVTLDLVVENWGRGNVGTMAAQHKGLCEDNVVFLNNKELSSWKIYPLEFKKSWTKQLSGWKSVESDQLIQGPGLFKATLTIDNSQNYDNFIDMQEWNKGLVLINGFPLGKYAFIGPQQTLYLPRPFLQNGDNEIIIFEHYEPTAEVKFSTDIIYNVP